MRSLFLLLLVAVTYWGCDTAEPTAATEQPDYLLAHTSGTISRTAPIQLTLDSTYAADDLRLEFSPPIPGEWRLNGRQLRFTPTTPLTSGQAYTATLHLRTRPSYTFAFATPARRLQLEADGYYIPDPDAPARVQLTGRLLTNDGATPEELRDVLTATYRDTPLEVELAQESANVFTYTATIPDRGTEPATAVISYTGSGGFAGEAGVREVRVPPVGAFELLDVTALPHGEGILARFSEPLDPRQDLTGLLRLQPETGVTYAIDGNLVTLYPATTPRQEVTVIAEPRIRSRAGTPLAERSEWQLTLTGNEPGLRAVSNGTIMPHEGRRLFSFEARGLDRVYFELFRIEGERVVQFLQEHSLDATSAEWQLRRVGNIVARDIVPLTSLDPAAGNQQWKRYAIDLGEYLAEEQTAALYQVRIGYGLEFTEQECGTTLADYGLRPLAEQLAARTDFTVGFARDNSLLTDYSGIYDYYDWEARDDPCSPAYYHRERFLLQNVLSSNLGLIAKRNPDRSTLVFTTNLITALPQGGASVTAYSYAGTEVYTGTTDDEGRLRFTTEEEPAFVIAQLKQERAYLRLQQEDALPLGRFAVAGSEAPAGIRGAFFAERGVWRPGDTVFLHFVLEDRAGVLPADYPINFTLTDAQGRVVSQRNGVRAAGHGLYPLTVTTGAEDVTGNWTARVEAAGQTYTRRLMIESVKPNRLAISLEEAGGGSLRLASEWLYGAPASGLRATVSATVQQRNVDFAGLTDYVYQDPARALPPVVDELQLFDGMLSAEGTARIDKPAVGDQLPGPLQLRLATRVYEPGGNFSMDNTTVPYDPYGTYVGLQLPRDEWENKSLPVDGTREVQLVTVNSTGEAVANRNLTVGVYRVDWRYWWQDGNDNVARFASSAHTESIASYPVTTDGRGRASLALGVDDWGRYLLRVCDTGGHCTGDYFYGGNGQGNNDDRQAAAILRLQADRSTVRLGERVTVDVPSSAGGQLLVSLETGAGSVEQFWVPTAVGQTQVSFTTTERMVPTVYANVTYLQPYAQTTNDRPVRLYGVVPVTVEQEETRLQPQIETADAWSPGETVAVTVSEAEGRDMTYVLAVVDEGLLGLTRFATPDLHEAFFSKEALGVTTYDLYDHVASSLGGTFGQALAVGGDEGVVAPEEESASRFPPVVRTLGPYTLRGGRATHELNLPNYLGAVRVMLVAVGKRAYGSAEQRVSVAQPLMVLPTLPRVLGPEETVRMPVSVFATEPGISQVTVSVAERSGLLTTPTSATSLDFNSVGNQLTYLPLEVGPRTGTAEVTVTATSGRQRSSQEVAVAVRLPNPPVTRTSTTVVQPGATETVTYQPFGLAAEQRVTAELSGLPAMNLVRHRDYLLSYPYGCAEQTISAAFAQLYVDQLLPLTAGEEQRRGDHIVAGLTALRRFTTSAGALALWPGDRQANPWVTNYGLHFLIAAEREGYGVPYPLKQGLLQFEQSAAARWTETGGAYYASFEQRALDQAYRLYVLALAGSAELGAMNRLRGLRERLPLAARYQLAAAYGLAGRPEAGRELLRSAGEEAVRDYRELGYTFGSELRDMAIVLDAQLALGDTTAAARQALRLAEQVGSRQWLSTQEAAFTFVALGKLGGSADRPVRAALTLPSGTATDVGVVTGVYAVELPTLGTSYTVRNTGNQPLYLTTNVTGVPRAGEELASSERLRLSVDYRDLNGQPLAVDALRSGTEFVASYTITNPGSTGQAYRQLALRTLLPSGWEVTNTRMSGQEQRQDVYDYQDLRDDRVHTFFDLPVGAARTFTFRLTATYPGRYYLPTQVSEAMYDASIRAATKGRWIEVLPSS